MSDHEERVEHPEVSRARKAVGAEPEGVPNAIVSDLLDRYDAMKAERDAAVRRAEEAEEALFRAHEDECWRRYDWERLPDGDAIETEGPPALYSHACPICRRALGKAAS